MPTVHRCYLETVGNFFHTSYIVFSYQCKLLYETLRFWLLVSFCVVDFRENVKTVGGFYRQYSVKVSYFDIVFAVVMIVRRVSWRRNPMSEHEKFCSISCCKVCAPNLLKSRI